MNSLVYWIWLSLACTPDTPTFAKLISSFDTAEEIYSAEDREIRACIGAKTSDCAKLLNKDLSRAEEIYNFCVTKQIGILTYDDENFPITLRDIPTPPVLLYYRGHLPDFTSSFRCAVVGTRLLSQYGRKNAFSLGYDLASAGAIVVSGMALGIDSVALAGALSAGGTTVAVIGSGIDVCYPIQHKKLAREIVKRGCVFTEYAPGTKPERFNFPRRNRLISGLCAATVVVEGKESSGSLITARHAFSQGRTVYAVPGNVGDPGSQVSNLLLKNGAKVCTSADDIVNDFEKIYLGKLNPFTMPERLPVNMMNVLREYEIGCVTPSDDIFRAPKANKPQNNEAQNAINKKLDDATAPEPTSFDKQTLKLYKRIPADTDCSIEDLVDDENDLRSVTRLLLKLEMGRFIKMLPGDRVMRNIK